jgi:Flp pilus assembly secretin CpaC/tetratricopeptide (TPR) repeat protein
MSRKVIAGLCLGILLGAPCQWATAETVNPDAEAAKRLEQQALEEQRLRDEVKLQSQSHLEAGKRLYKAFEYKAAQAELLRAVNLNQSNEEARQLLVEVNDVLNKRQDRIQSAVQSLAKSQQVAIQERLVTLDNRIDWGNRFVAQAQEDPDLTTAERIRRYQQALDAFERARELIKWMPVGVNVAEQQHQAERMIGEVRKSVKGLEVQLTEEDKQKAMDLSAARATMEHEQEQRRVAVQLDEVKALFEIGEYERAEMLAGRILESDSTNAEAHAIQITARDRKHIKKTKWIKEEYDEQFKRQMELADKTVIPHEDYLVYPDNWAEIAQRTGHVGRTRTDEPWKMDIMRKLSRKVSFEFVDTPLQEALTFLQTLSKVNIILDPRAAAGGASQLKITLRVTDMDMETALKWILRLAELDYDLRGQAIYISTRANLATNVELEIYDIRDLTSTVTDFPAPRIELSSNTQGGGAGVNFVQPTTAPTLAAPDMAQLIRERLLPADFSDASTSIEEQGGKLVVMQRPEVHGKIRRILQSFRETQAVQVLTQVRFIDTKDGFLEQIGVHFAGLDGQTATGIANPYGVPNSHSLYPMGGGPGVAAYPGQQFTTHGGPIVHPRLDTSLPNNDATVYPNGMPTGFRKQFGASQLLQAVTSNVVRTLTSGPLGSALTGGDVGTQGLLMQFRFLHSIQANMVLQAVRKDQTSDTLIATKLMQFNNQRAHVLVANQQSYIYDYDVSGDAWDPIIRTLTTGTVLEVKPTVSHDRKYITLDLRPGVAEFIRFRQIGTYDSPDPIDNGVDGSAVAVGLIRLPIDLPEIELRFVNTTVTVPDCGTLLFSGLINDHKLDGKTGVPFFSDLPVIGRIFSTNIKQRERRNLLILVNSRVVLFDEEEEQL